jgi:hypothetical protein
MAIGRGESWLARAQVRAAIRRFTDDGKRRKSLDVMLARCEWEQGRAAAYSEWFRCQDFEFSRFLRALN